LFLLAEFHFLIVVHVIPNLFQISAIKRNSFSGWIAEFTFQPFIQTGLILIIIAMASSSLSSAETSGASQRQDFSLAWRAARHGKRADFERFMPALQDYLLFPYLQYEDLRYRRGRVGDEEMSSFLEAHDDWVVCAARHIQQAIIAPCINAF
jgi:hypothetical protein